MKRILIVFLLAANFCNAQGFFQVGVLGGGSGYAGDLTNDNISIKTIRAGGGVERGGLPAEPGSRRKDVLSQWPRSSGRAFFSRRD